MRLLFLLAIYVCGVVHCRRSIATRRLEQCYKKYVHDLGCPEYDEVIQCYKEVGPDYYDKAVLDSYIKDFEVMKAEEVHKCTDADGNEFCVRTEVKKCTKQYSLHSCDFEKATACLNSLNSTCGQFASIDYQSKKMVTLKNYCDSGLSKNGQCHTSRWNRCNTLIFDRSRYNCDEKDVKAAGTCVRNLQKVCPHEYAQKHGENILYALSFVCSNITNY